MLKKLNLKLNLKPTLETKKIKPQSFLSSFGKSSSFKTKKASLLLFWVISSTGENPSLMEKIMQNLSTFFHIWPLGQWIGSLVTLILLYIITGHYYNKRLHHWGGWIDFKTRVWLIVFDLSLNLVLGLYYMNYRETVMGIIMMRCPIAISPLIFVVELAVIILYRRYILQRKDSDSPKK